MSHLLPSCQLPALISQLQHPLAPFAIRSQSRPTSRAPHTHRGAIPSPPPTLSISPGQGSSTGTPLTLPAASNPSPVVVPQARHKHPQLHALRTTLSLFPCPHSTCKHGRQRSSERGALSGGTHLSKATPRGASAPWGCKSGRAAAGSGCKCAGSRFLTRFRCKPSARDSNRVS